jgi:hypothetical protein
MRERSQFAEPHLQQLRLEVDDTPWLVNVKARAVSIAIAASENYTFDLDGRLYAAFVDGRNYRRGLDGRVLAKYSQETPAGSSRVRRFLTESERRSLLQRMSRRVAELAAALPAPSAGQSLPLAPWIGRLQRWDQKALAEHAGRFHEVYRSVSILPPDQYMALVIQSSEGCPWNRCTFCSLYRDRVYRLKSEEELRRHIDAIIELLGDGIRLRRSVFLGDANLLCAPTQRLLSVFEMVARQLGKAGGPTGPFFGFADADGVLRHSVAQLAALRESGLHRVYLGLETGNDQLLGLLQKPARARDMVDAVQALRQAGLHAGVIVLLGLGGVERSAEHERDTIAALNAMELGRGDIIYFSPLIEHEDLDYRCQRAGLGLQPMDQPAMRQQQQRIRSRLVYGSGVPLTSIYDIRDFIY